MTFIEEARAYLERLPTLRGADRSLLETFERQIPLVDESLMVLIPCYAEELGLYDCFRAYSQSGIPERCLFIVFINAGESIGKERFQNKVDKLEKEIEQARRDFPEAKIVSITHHFSGKPSLSRIRGLLTDAVISKCLKMEISDPLIVSNDADALFYAVDYLKNIRDAFDSNPSLDYVSGEISWSGVDADGMVRYRPQRAMPEIYLNDLFGQIGDDIYRQFSPVYTTGCNSAYRLASLCQINGYDYNFAPFFDVEIGRVLNKFRGTMDSASSARHALFLQNCHLVTNPRRAIHAHLKKIPYGLQFETFADTFGTEIELETCIEAYTRTDIFIQIEDLLGRPQSEDKVETRIESVFRLWLDGEPVSNKRFLAQSLAPKLGLAIKQIHGTDEDITQIDFDWQNSALLPVLQNWARLHNHK